MLSSAPRRNAGNMLRDAFTRVAKSTSPLNPLPHRTPVTTLLPKRAPLHLSQRHFRIRKASSRREKGRKIFETLIKIHPSIKGRLLNSRWEPLIDNIYLVKQVGVTKWEGPSTRMVYVEAPTVTQPAKHRTALLTPYRLLVDSSTGTLESSVAFYRYMYQNFRVLDMQKLSSDYPQNGLFATDLLESRALVHKFNFLIRKLIKVVSIGFGFALFYVFKKLWQRDSYTSSLNLPPLEVQYIPVDANHGYAALPGQHQMGMSQYQYHPGQQPHQMYQSHQQPLQPQFVSQQIAQVQSEDGRTLSQAEIERIMKHHASAVDEATNSSWIYSLLTGKWFTSAEESETKKQEFLQKHMVPITPTPLVPQSAHVEQLQHPNQQFHQPQQLPPQPQLQLQQHPQQFQYTPQQQYQTLQSSQLFYNNPPQQIHSQPQQIQHQHLPQQYQHSQHQHQHQHQPQQFQSQQYQAYQYNPHAYQQQYNQFSQQVPPPQQQQQQQFQPAPQQFLPPQHHHHQQQQQQQHIPFPNYQSSSQLLYTPQSPSYYAAVGTTQAVPDHIDVLDKKTDMNDLPSYQQSYLSSMYLQPTQLESVGTIVDEDVLKLNKDDEQIAQTSTTSKLTSQFKAPVPEYASVDLDDENARADIPAKNPDDVSKPTYSNTTSEREKSAFAAITQSSNPNRDPNFRAAEYQLDAATVDKIIKPHKIDAAGLYGTRAPEASKYILPSEERALQLDKRIDLHLDLEARNQELNRQRRELSAKIQDQKHRSKVDQERSFEEQHDYTAVKLSHQPNLNARYQNRSKPGDYQYQDDDTPVPLSYQPSSTAPQVNVKIVRPPNQQ